MYTFNLHFHPNCYYNLHNYDGSSSKRKNKSRQKGDVPPEFVTLQEESVLQTMLSDARPITSLVVLKPSAVQRHLGRLLKRLAQEDFQTVALRTAVLTTEQAKCYIPFTDQQVCLKCFYRVTFL